MVRIQFSNIIRGVILKDSESVISGVQEIVGQNLSAVEIQKIEAAVDRSDISNRLSELGLAVPSLKVNEDRRKILGRNIKAWSQALWLFPLDAKNASSTLRDIATAFSFTRQEIFRAIQVNAVGVMKMSVGTSGAAELMRSSKKFVTDSTSNAYSLVTDSIERTQSLYRAARAMETVRNMVKVFKTWHQRKTFFICSIVKVNRS